MEGACNMPIVRFWIIMALLAPAPWAGQAQTAGARELNSLTPEQRAAGWKLLFDGADTSQWRGYKKQTLPDGWQAQDGALVRVGRGGDIITVEQFENFELSLEWKIAEGGNSGIMYRVSEEGGAPWHTGPEYQLLDDEKAKEANKSASCYGLYQPSQQVSRPAGEWNHTRIIISGNQVEHWLNGVKVVEFELGSEDWNARVARSKFNRYPQFGKVRRGHIALQDHGNMVAFRNIKIRPLPAAPAD
jgi:hypothetical protein